MTDDLDSDGALDGFFPLDGGVGPARRITSPAADALVGSVLDAWEAAPPPPPGGTSSRVGRFTGVVGALVLVVAGSTAWVIGTREAAPPTPFTAPEPAPATSSSPEPPRVREPAPSVEQAPAPAIEQDTASTPETRSPREQRTPVDLLEQANALRREGRHAEAEATYRRVVALAPSSREAHVARVAAGTLRLDRLDDPRGAARLFRAAMRAGSGGLAAEATFGLARASRASGERASEVAALRALVTQHPGSPYSGIASRRLVELGEDPVAP